MLRKFKNKILKTLMIDMMIAAFQFNWNKQFKKVLCYYECGYNLN